MKAYLLMLISLMITEGLCIADQKTGYRTFPLNIDHPSKAPHLTEEEFEKINKVKIEEAPSFCHGHVRTVIWYSDEEHTYIIQIDFKNQPPMYMKSICTFTPTFGMDKIDGCFAQDIEAQILKDVLNVDSERLTIFQGKESIEITEYLWSRGFATRELEK